MTIVSITRRYHDLKEFHSTDPVVKDIACRTLDALHDLSLSDATRVKRVQSLQNELVAYRSKQAKTKVAPQKEAAVKMGLGDIKQMEAMRKSITRREVSTPVEPKPVKKVSLRPKA